VIRFFMLALLVVMAVWPWAWFILVRIPELVK
jgi:hypothetical protein